MLVLWTAGLPGGGVTFFIATPYGLLRGKRLLPCPVKRVFLFNDLSPKCHEGTQIHRISGPKSKLQNYIDKFPLDLRFHVLIPGSNQVNAA